MTAVERLVTKWRKDDLPTYPLGDPRGMYAFACMSLCIEELEAAIAEDHA